VAEDLLIEVDRLAQVVLLVRRRQILEGVGQVHLAARPLPGVVPGPVDLEGGSQ